MADTSRPEAARRLVVLRHAKSDWPQNVADHERPLGERGRRDAPAAGRWLRDAGLAVDQVTCSTAVRARDTWQLAGDELVEGPEPWYTSRVYGAGIDELVDVLRESDADAGTVVLVGHNPGLHGLVLTLADDDRGATYRQVRAKFPTSAVAVFDVPGAWTDLRPGRATLTGFAVPRG